MIFGEIPLEDAVGARLAHSHMIEMDGEMRKLAKGTELGPDHVAALRAIGVKMVMAARLEPDDVGENQAASAVARKLPGANVRAAAAFTGRSNLIAEAAGVVLIDEVRVAALNGIDESLTLATLRNFDDVREGQMLGTVKIIPFAAPSKAIEAAKQVVGEGGVIKIARYKPRKVGLLSTVFPSTKPSLHQKARRVMDGRLAKSGSAVVADLVVPHEISAVAKGLKQLSDAGADLLVAFSGSAVVDRGDVVPAGLEEAGGQVIHFGLPVDPGNLAVLGEMAGVPVIGAPSCARTPKLNGFDWVLDRLIADVPITHGDIAAMGVGGLLKEIGSRPQPRAGAKSGVVTAPTHRAPRIAVVLLAAGRSSRMGLENKLTLEFRGRPMVRWAAEAALASVAKELIVVTGHEADKVTSVLKGAPAKYVHNPDFADGLSTSLATGLTALKRDHSDIDGAIILLGDMPGVNAADLDQLISAFDPDEGRAIVVPTVKGQRGNPVLWGQAFFDDLCALHGDVGARHLIGEHDDVVVEVELGREVLEDIDTPEALAAAIQKP